MLHDDAHLPYGAGACVAVLERLRDSWRRLETPASLLNDGAATLMGFCSLEAFFTEYEFRRLNILNVGVLIQIPGNTESVWSGLFYRRL